MKSHLFLLVTLAMLSLISLQHEDICMQHEDICFQHEDICCR